MTSQREISKLWT